MSAVYVAISLVNLILICTYIIYIVYIRAIKKYDDVLILKTQYMLSFAICIMFMILFVLDIIIKKSWMLSSTFNCISFSLWAVCTVLNFSTFERKKTSTEIEAFTKLLALYVIPNKKVDDKKEKENSSSLNDESAAKENE